MPHQGSFRISCEFDFMRCREKSSLYIAYKNRYVYIAKTTLLIYAIVFNSVNIGIHNINAWIVYCFLFRVVNKAPSVTITLVR